MKETLYLLTDFDVARYTSIQQQTSTDSLLVYVKMAQDQQLKEILPKSLYDKMAYDFNNGGLTGEYKLLYDDYIQDMLIYYTGYHLVNLGNYKIGDAGIMKASPENFETVDLDDINAVSQKYFQLGTSVQNQFEKNKHLYNIPELKENDSCKKNQNNAGFNMPWFLEY